MTLQDRVIESQREATEDLLRDARAYHRLRAAIPSVARQFALDVLDEADDLEDARRMLEGDGS